jgi:hypothetical protein
MAAVQPKDRTAADFVALTEWREWPRLFTPSSLWASFHCRGKSSARLWGVTPHRAEHSPSFTGRQMQRLRLQSRIAHTAEAMPCIRVAQLNDPMLPASSTQDAACPRRMNVKRLRS